MNCNVSANLHSYRYLNQSPEFRQTDFRIKYGNWLNERISQINTTIFRIALKFIKQKLFTSKIDLLFISCIFRRLCTI